MLFMTLSWFTGHITIGSPRAGGRGEMMPHQHEWEAEYPYGRFCAVCGKTEGIDEFGEDREHDTSEDRRQNSITKES